MLFKILHGDASRISTDITPFHEGYCYVTHDGYMYIDINIGTETEPNNQRIKLNARDAETLMGASLAKIINNNELEIPTSSAVFAALSNKADKAHTHEIADVNNLQASLDQLLNDAKTYTNTAVSGKADKVHCHDDLYYTIGDIDGKLQNKANTADIPKSLSELEQDANHRVVTDNEKTTWSAKSDFSGDYNDLTNKPSIPSIDGLATEGYADSAATTAANAVKNELLNGAGEAYDTLKELGALIDENTDAIGALELVATGKADKEHNHEISDVIGLQGVIDNLNTTISNITAITNDEIDAICGATIYAASEVMF